MRMLPLAPIHAQAYEQLWSILSNVTACILHKNVNKPTKCYVPHYFQTSEIHLTSTMLLT